MTNDTHKAHNTHAMIQQLKAILTSLYEAQSYIYHIRLCSETKNAKQVENIRIYANAITLGIRNTCLIIGIPRTSQT